MDDTASSCSCINRDTSDAFGRSVLSCCQHSLIIFATLSGALAGITGWCPCLTAFSNYMDTFGYDLTQNYTSYVRIPNEYMSNGLFGGHLHL